MQIYSSDHPGHGVTEWDHLEVLIDPENKNRVLIQPAADIEDLEYGEL